MKRLTALLVLVCAIFAAPAYSADENPGVSFWERLRMKIEMLTPRKKIATTTAVGGVRGSMADAEEVYWKGEAKTQSIDSDELAAFKKAVSLVDAGDTAAAQVSFADFVKKHPDSQLRPDAESALAQLRPKK